MRVVELFEMRKREVEIPAFGEMRKQHNVGDAAQKFVLAVDVFLYEREIVRLFRFVDFQRFAETVAYRPVFYARQKRLHAGGFFVGRKLFVCEREGGDHRFLERVVGGQLPVFGGCALCEFSKFGNAHAD